MYVILFFVNRGMYTLFGTQELTPRGYILDVNATINTNTRLPIIITDKKYICGRRIVLGTGDLSIATQVITSLLIGGEDASTSVEGPRFRILDSNIIGIEGNTINSLYLKLKIKCLIS